MFLDILESKFSFNSLGLNEEQTASLGVALRLLGADYQRLSTDIFAKFCAENDVFRKMSPKEIELMKQLTEDVILTLVEAMDIFKPEFRYFKKYKNFITHKNVSKLNATIKSFIISPVKNLNTKALGAALEILLSRVEAKIEDMSDFNNQEL